MGPSFRKGSRIPSGKEGQDGKNNFAWKIAEGLHPENLGDVQEAVICQAHTIVQKFGAVRVVSIIHYPAY